jgi:hypothetical protein
LVQRDEMSLARPDDLRDRRRYPATICPSHFPVSGNGLCIRRRNPSLISRSLVCMRSRGGGNARHLTCSHVSTPHDPRRPPGKSGSHWTRRWRKADSNSWSRFERNVGNAEAACVLRRWGGRDQQTMPGHSTCGLV